MKKRFLALLAASAMVLGAGAVMAGCNTPAEPEHTTHYDVNADGKCDKCGEDMEGHSHIYSKKWSSDATYHWHAAVCAHDGEVSEKAEHEFDEGGLLCRVCKAINTAPVAPVEGVYHYEAEYAELDDKDVADNATMTIELNKHEWNNGSGNENGPLVSNVGYFGGSEASAGQTITWRFNAAEAAENVKVTLRMASSVGTWDALKITEIDLGAEGAPSLSVNDSAVSLKGKKLDGLDNLTQNDMQNGVAYHNFCDIVIMINLVAGENTIVLTSGSKGVNVDKIMIETTIALEFSRTNNLSRPSSH